MASERDPDRGYATLWIIDRSLATLSGEVDLTDDFPPIVMLASPGRC